MVTLANAHGDFRCPDEKYSLDAVESLMYVGIFAGYLTLSLVGGMVGRKTLMMGAMTMALVGFTTTILSTSIGIAGLGLLFSIFGVCSASNVTFFYLAETVSENYREKYSVFVQICSGIGVVLNIFAFYVFRNWTAVLTVFYLLPSIYITVQIYRRVKDTPFCLVMRLQPEEAHEEFRQIAAMNSVEFTVTVEEIGSLRDLYEQNHFRESDSQNFNILDLFRFPSLKGMTLLLVSIEMIISLLFFAPALMMDQFRFNIFVDGLVVGFSELLAYPLCYFLIMLFSRRGMAFFCFSLTTATSLLLFFTWSDSPTQGNGLLLVLIFVLRFTITVEYTFFYVYFMELYPTQVRVLGTSFVALCGGVMVSMAPEIIDFFKNNGFPITLLFALFSVLAIVCSYFLPESFHTVPPEVILELKSRDSRSMSSSTFRPSRSSKRLPVEMSGLNSKGSLGPDILPGTLGKI